MTTKKRIVCAGVGAMLPTIANLYIVELNIIIAQFSMLALFGYIVKSIVLFAVGGFFGYYYSEEKEPLKLIQLGLAVPALLLSIANGSNVPTAKIGDPKNSEVRQSNVLTIDAAVYAAEDAGTGSKPAKMPGIKRFTLPSLSPFQQFWRGVTSRPLCCGYRQTHGV